MPQCSAMLSWVRSCFWILEVSYTAAEGALHCPTQEFRSQNAKSDKRGYSTLPSANTRILVAENKLCANVTPWILTHFPFSVFILTNLSFPWSVFTSELSGRSKSVAVWSGEGASPRTIKPCRTERKQHKWVGLQVTNLIKETFRDRGQVYHRPVPSSYAFPRVISTKRIAVAMSKA